MESPSFAKEESPNTKDVQSAGPSTSYNINDSSADKPEEMKAPLQVPLEKTYTSPLITVEKCPSEKEKSPAAAADDEEDDDYAKIMA